MRDEPTAALPDPRNAEIIVYVGGELLPRAEAKVSVFDSSVQGGDAVWEGLRVYSGKVFRLDEHLDRLFEAAKAIDLDIGMDREGVTRAEYVLPATEVAASGFLTLDEAQLGFDAAGGDRLFLYSPGQAVLLDARSVDNRLRGRSEQHEGRWLYPDVATFGSVFFRDFRPEETGEFIRRVLAAGFIPIGRTNSSEFGLLPTTEPVLHGPTRNPWNTAHSSGGSSGGAAAATAARIVPMAHASDGGGSIRIPASAAEGRLLRRRLSREQGRCRMCRSGRSNRCISGACRPLPRRSDSQRRRAVSG